MRTYGAMVALAFSVGFLLIYREAKRKNFYPDKILDLEFLMLVSGIIGARALHVLVNPGYYRENLIDIFFIWKGGLALYGGLILAIFVSRAFILKNKMPLWKTADLIAPYIALGQSIGRVGCFFNGCCFGKIATLSFLHPAASDSATYRYAVQLYAALALFAIFMILKVYGTKSRFAGFVFSLYLILYSTQRFFLDFLRGDTPVYAVNLTISQYISIGIFTITILYLLLAHGKNGRNKTYRR